MSRISRRGIKAMSDSPLVSHRQQRRTGQHGFFRSPVGKPRDGSFLAAKTSFSTQVNSVVSELYRKFHLPGDCGRCGAK
jgi:hypothetical protein